jgi:tungstate transport system substrate-binding protein
MFNQYSVIAVSPDNCPDVKYDLATRFIQWIISPGVQKAIGEFRLMGQQLFIPNAQ